MYQCLPAPIYAPAKRQAPGIRIKPGMGLFRKTNGEMNRQAIQEIDKEVSL